MSDGRPFQISSNYLYQPQSGGSPVTSFASFPVLKSGVTFANIKVWKTVLGPVYTLRVRISAVASQITNSDNTATGSNSIFVGAVDPTDGVEIGLLTHYLESGISSDLLSQFRILPDGSCSYSLYGNSTVRFSVAPLVTEFTTVWFA